MSATCGSPRAATTARAPITGISTGGGDISLHVAVKVREGAGDKVQQLQQQQ